MKKTSKKLDNSIVKALTEACEQAKIDVPGFDWLTHTADFANFPGSLHVICVFDKDESLKTAKQMNKDLHLIKLIHASLLRAGILLKTPKRHISFDTEEACERENQGNWKKRLDA